MRKIYCINCLELNDPRRDTCMSCGLPLPTRLNSDELLPVYTEGNDAETQAERIEYLEDRVASLTKTVEDMFQILQDIPGQLSLEVAAVEKLNQYIDGSESVSEGLDHFWNEKMQGYLGFIENRESYKRKAGKILVSFDSSEKEKFSKFLDRAEVLFYSNKPHKSLGLLERALRMAPENHELLYFIGEKYFMLQRPQKAAAIWQKVLELKPDHYRAALMSGIMKMISGQMDEARNMLKEAIHQKPDSIVPILALATLEYHAEDFKEAEKFVGMANSLSETAYGHILLAENFARVDDKMQAARELEKASNLQPDDKLVLIKLANIYLDSGSVKQARETFSKISSLSPKEQLFKELASKTSKIEMMELAKDREELNDSSILLTSVSQLLLKEMEL